MEYASGLLVATLLFDIIVLIASFAIYFVGAYGLYKIAKNTGVKNPWFGFIPVLNLFLVGKLADRYNKNRGKKSNLAVLLLVLSIAPTIVIFLFLGIMLFSAAGLYYYFYDFSAVLVMGILPLLFGILISSIAAAVLRIYAFYLVFQDFEPSRAVPYTILTFFGLEFIALILIRNNIPVGMAGEQYPLQPKFK